MAERQQKERAVKYRWRNKAGKSRQKSGQQKEINPFWKITTVIKLPLNCSFSCDCKDYKIDRIDRIDRDYKIV